MIKPWAKLQSRTEPLLKALVTEGVDSKELLEETWKSNNKYLLSEYILWLPQELHYEVNSSWPLNK